MGSGRAGPGREYLDFSLKYERTPSARCARSLVINGLLKIVSLTPFEFHFAHVLRLFVPEIFKGFSSSRVTRRSLFGWSQMASSGCFLASRRRPSGAIAADELHHSPDYIGGGLGRPSTRPATTGNDWQDWQRLATTGDDWRRPATTGNDRQRPATTGNDRQRLATTGNDRQRPATTGNDWQRPATTGNDRQRPATTGNDRQRPATTGNDRQRLATTGNDRQRAATTGKHRQ